VPQWGPFLAVVVVLTVLLLVLARQSQQLISEQADNGRAGEQPAGAPTATPEATVGDETGEPTVTPEATVGDETSASGGIDSRGGVESGAPEGVVRPDSTQTTGSDRPAERLELTSRAMLANVASTQALFAGVIIAAAWYFSIPAEAFGAPVGSSMAGLRAIVLGIGFGAVLWLANELATTVADAAGAAYDESVRRLLAPESVGGWVGLLLVVLPLVALAEELLFRAALVGVPAAGFDVSPWLLAVVASIAFALGHGAQGRVGVLVTGLLGLVLAAGYILTGSLLVVVVAHYVINTLEFLLHELLDVEAVWSFAVRSG